MTQFASTLYPQTNPTNPILLEFRIEVRWGQENGKPFAHTVEDSLRACKRTWWGYDEASDAHLWHAKQVLTRLAALS